MLTYLFFLILINRRGNGKNETGRKGENMGIEKSINTQEDGSTVMLCICEPCCNKIESDLIIHTSRWKIINLLV